MSTDEATLIFDGDCGFCTTAANFIAKHTSTPIVIHPWQFIDLSIYGLTEEQVAAKVHMVVAGRAFAGHEAFAQILKVQKSIVLRVLGSIVLLPPISWLARPAYFLVAKYRHKLPGGTPACKLERE
ncbi:MAG: thiol-disulfide oxidoreductase DCC family protein [Microbacteriaceae bacterium]